MDDSIEFFPQQLAFWSGLRASQPKATIHSDAMYIRRKVHSHSAAQSLIEYFVSRQLTLLSNCRAMLMRLTFLGLVGLDRIECLRRE